jgi:hypothetical protein
MTQISKGDTFVDGQQVTGARLNQLVDSSVLLVGAITAQPSITANTLVATDSTIVNDGGVLKEATIGDFLNSNLPITTSSITGGAGVDLVLTPAATRKFDVAGAFEADSINSVGAATIGGTLSVTGTTTLTGNATANGSLTTNSAFNSTGTANFTGTLQYKSTPIFGLYAVQVNPISALVSAGSGSTATVYSSLNTSVRGAGGTNWWLTQGHTHYSETIVVPSGELWTVEYSPLEIARDSDDSINFVCLKDGVPFAGTNVNTLILQYSHFTTHAFYALSSGTHVFLWKSVIINGSGTDVVYVDVFGNCTRKIHKYKTA